MAKRKQHQFIDTVDECMTNAVNNGIFHLNTQDESLNGRDITIRNEKVINFGSCSYLGLEMDDRLIMGTIDAAKRYGTQFSSSRLFISCGIYEEAEALLSKIYGLPTLIAPTTSLGHIGVLPVIIRDEDAVILDHQVHGSVRNAVEMIRPKGLKVEMIRHSSMRQLEELVIQLRNKHDKIWYMIDGVYSMYGDYAPLKEIEALMDKYPQLYLYADDAHAMSWAGENGKGYVLSQIPHHKKMVVATSLCKAFGAGAAALIFPDEEMKRKVRTCGSSFTYSGPVQPPMLGAIIESAKIHLTSEINSMQQALKEKIDYCMKLINDYKLPLVRPSDSPIQYIGLGLPRTGYNMVNKMIKRGFYVDIGIFPGVPIKCTGIRLAITLHHSFDDIKKVVDAIYEEFPVVLEEEKQTIADISEYFGIEFEDPFHLEKNTTDNHFMGLKLIHETTIRKIDKAEWDYFLGENGSFDWEGLRFLEESFSNNLESENNWEFHYFIIKDKDNGIILVTFFTVLITKDDMLSPSFVSEKIEEQRINDKYYLSTKVLMMGSLFTVGDHMYLNKENENWEEAMVLLLENAKKVQIKSNATAIQLRDIDTDDWLLSDFFSKHGFVKVNMPDTHIVQNLNKWESTDEYLNVLNKKQRQHVKKFCVAKQEEFRIEVVNTLTENELNIVYDLYLNVKNKSLQLNTYDMPKKVLENMIDHCCWEFLLIRLKQNDEIVGVFFNYKTKKHYGAMAAGLDYNYVKSHGVYRQAIFQSILRAKELGKELVYIGMEAPIEKRKFDAIAYPKSVFIQMEENFNMEKVNLIF